MSEQCKKLRRIANNPAAVIANNIAQLTKRIDKTKDWQEIIQQNIISFLANPLTGQTGTDAEKKSLKEYIEDCKQKHSYFCLSEAKDEIGRRYQFKMNFNTRRKSVTFSIVCFFPCVEENGDDQWISRTRFIEISISTVDVANHYAWNQDLLWDAHFKVSCEFDSIVNNNCLCEFRRKIKNGSNAGMYVQRCTHKKGINSKFCFGHMHKGCVDNP